MAVFSVQDTLHRGYQQHLAGDLATAARSYADVLAADPENADAWHLAGLVASQQGQLPTAEQLLRYAVQLRPADPTFAANLAAVLLTANQAGEAEQLCRQVLAGHPDHVAARIQLSTALRQQQRLDEAAAVLTGLLSERPADVSVLCNLSAVELDRGAPETALPLLLRAREADPQRAEVHSNLGAVQRQLGLLAESRASLERAVALAPRLAEPRINRGNLLLEAGRPMDALADFQLALELQPRSVSALTGLGQSLRTLGQWDEALQALQLAVQQHDRQLAGATAGTPRQAAALTARSRLMSDLLYCSSLVPTWRRSDVYQLHAEWGRGLEAAVTPRQHPRGRDPDRRLRVGYVSADFRQHATMRFFLPLLQAHDASQVEVTCYSGSPRCDAITALAQQHAARWRTTCGVPDQQLADRIQSDEIDILVDLAGHTGGNRLPVFAVRPAPVQVSFLGYPNTTGLTRVDYVLSDVYREDAESARLFTEQLVAMPHGACCFGGAAEELLPAEPPVCRHGYVTLGSTHRLEKLSPQCLQLWAAVLQAVPQGRLRIIRDVLQHDAALRTQLLQQLQQAGIPPERVDLDGDVPRNHLEIYARLDLLLDVFPWNSGTTAYEAMWMGVPVPALNGVTEFSRVAASFLAYCGCPQWIATSPEHYVQLVAGLARDTAALQRARRMLREQMRETVGNAPRFAEDVERVYRGMWLRHCGDARWAELLPLIPRAAGAAA